MPTQPRPSSGSQNFLAHYRAIAEGTAVGAPVDPLPPALAELQVDLQDALAKFQADLTVIRDEAFRRIQGKHPSETSTHMGVTREPSFSILPVTEGRGGEFVGRGREEVLQAMSRAGEKVMETGASGKLSVESDSSRARASDADSDAHSAKHEEL